MTLITSKKSKNLKWHVVLGVGAAVVTSRIIASYILPQFDDSFIILRHARNLAMGYGFAFNRGTTVLGVSCPLFGILEAFFFSLHLPMPITILFLNIGLDILILIWGMRLLSQSEEKVSAIIFGIVFALSPALARIAIGGMEVNLFLLLCLLSISLFHSGKTTLAIILASITFFIREEAVLLVAILIALEFFRGSKKKAILLSGLSLLSVLPGLAILYYYYGGIIPQSVAIKLGWRAPSILFPLHNLFLNDPLGIALLPFTLLGAWLAFHRRGPLQTLVLWTLLVTVVYCANRSYIMPWYGEVSHFVQFLLAALGFGFVFRRSTKISRFFEGNWIVNALAISVMAIWSFAAWKFGHSKVTMNIYDRLEEWGKSRSLQSSSIMARDIGAVGYYSDATIYDLDGLVWPSGARENPEEVVREFKPDFLFLVRSRGSYKLSQNPVIKGSYSLRTTFTQDTNVTFDKAPDAWNQNYMLFERIRR